ncbi:MAG: 50S ribosomal protein L21e [Candidatus Aenigmarchaeota archaeon]|nr:50S ribosomal protein L21e [Candidatus Aenigmarchaeota archaeon]
MVKKSHGPREKSRKKLKLDRKDVLTPNKFLQKFKVGDMVHIDLFSQTSIPHHKFQGKTGKILGIRGKSYIIEVTDLKAKKKIIVRPEHLKLMKR